MRFKRSSTTPDLARVPLSALVEEIMRRTGLLPDLALLVLKIGHVGGAEVAAEEIRGLRGEVARHREAAALAMAVCRDLAELPTIDERDGRHGA